MNEVVSALGCSSFFNSSLAFCSASCAQRDREIERERAMGPKMREQCEEGGDGKWRVQM